MYRFFYFYATTGAEKCNHQLVVATPGAFTLTSVMPRKRLPPVITVWKDKADHMLTLAKKRCAWECN